MSAHVEVLVLDCFYDVLLMLPPLQLVRALVLLYLAQCNPSAVK